MSKALKRKQRKWEKAGADLNAWHTHLVLRSGISLLQAEILALMGDLNHV